MKADRLLVADDEAATNRLMRAAMSMAVPNHIQVVLTPVAQTDFAAFAADSVRTLVLLRDVAAAMTARSHGLPAGVLNVGNVHAGAGRSQVTRSVFLTDLEKSQLRALIAGGMTVTLQAVPSEPSESLAG